MMKRGREERPTEFRVDCRLLGSYPETGFWEASSVSGALSVAAARAAADTRSAVSPALVDNVRGQICQTDDFGILAMQMVPTLLIDAYLGILLVWAMIAAGIFA
jgi:hypothetical protein